MCVCIHVRVCAAFLLYASQPRASLFLCPFPSNSPPQPTCLHSPSVVGTASVHMLHTPSIIHAGCTDAIVQRLHLLRDIASLPFRTHTHMCIPYKRHMAAKLPVKYLCVCLLRQARSGSLVSGWYKTVQRKGRGEKDGSTVYWLFTSERALKCTRGLKKYY